MKLVALVGMICVSSVPGGPHSIQRHFCRARGPRQMPWSAGPLVPGAVLTSLSSHRGRMREEESDGTWGPVRQPSRRWCLAQRLMTRVGSQEHTWSKERPESHRLNYPLIYTCTPSIHVLMPTHIHVSMCAHTYTDKHKKENNMVCGSCWPSEGLWRKRAPLFVACYFIVIFVPIYKKSQV